MQPPATVVIGDHTQGLGIVRSAAAAGGSVWVVNDKCISLARFSRHVSGYYRVPCGTLEALHDPLRAGQLRDMLLHIPFDGQAALFGVDEDVNRFVHQNRAALQPRYRIAEAQGEANYDKYAFNELVPEAHRIETHVCSEIDLAGLPRPQHFLLKGRCGNAFRQMTGYKAVRLSEVGSGQRGRLLARLGPAQVLVQAIIETQRPVRSVCSFSVDGRIAAWFGYDKLRQHPNRFGTGTYLCSVAVDDLKPVAEAILRSLAFTGLSEIEFIHDRDTDTYRVVEMNPRAWKSVHFATQCGQNLVARYLAYLAGEPFEVGIGYRSGCYWADLATDLPQMLREGKVHGYHKGFFECTWDRSDPWPALALWTLSPLIALENRIALRAGRLASAGR